MWPQVGNITPTIDRWSVRYGSEISEIIDLNGETYASPQSTFAHPNDDLGWSWVNISFCPIHSSKFI